MNADEVQLIRSLPLAPAPPGETEPAGRRRGITAAAPPSNGVIAGTNMVAFSEEMPESARNAVALNLLFAQEAAKGDQVATSPDLWVARHDMIFQNPLGWYAADGASHFTRHEKSGFDVHEAILPLLTAALGPAASAATLIITGLKQLKEIDKDQPWITLFERESRRFEHSEYRFAVADLVAGQVSLRIAAFRFAAVAERLQVLFFKKRDVSVEFSFSARTLGISAERLEKLRPDLEARLDDRSSELIAAIELPAFGRRP